LTQARRRPAHGAPAAREGGGKEEVSDKETKKDVTARSLLLVAGGCAVALMVVRFASAAPLPPPKAFCSQVEGDIDITSWVKEGKNHIPKDSIGAKLITPAKLEKMRKEGQIPMLESGVPKIVHQTWPTRNTSNIADHYKQWSASWGSCHPDWLHVLWDDCDIRRLFAKHLPSFLPVFDAYPNPVQRADIFRCLVTKEYGGAYADMDYECSGGIGGANGLNPPKSSKCKVFIVNSPDPEHDGILQNAFMASVPGHPYWDKVFELAVERRSTLYGRIFGEIPIQNTGPGLVSDAYSLLPDDEKEAVCGLNATEFSGQALGEAPNAIHRNAGSWCACRFPAINFLCWKKCKEKKKKYVPSMYRDLTRHKRKLDRGETLSEDDQAMWDKFGYLWPKYLEDYGEFDEDV